MRSPAFITFTAMLVLSACGTQPRGGDSDEAQVVPVNVAEPAPAALPTVEQPLTRRDLILAATEAASDLVTGVDDAERQQALDGRSFSFRIRLCDRDRVTFDSDQRVLRIAIKPDLDAANPVVASIGAEKFEAVEGFWVPYPWLLRAACPSAPTGMEQEGPDTPTGNEQEGSDAPAERLMPAPPTLGLAQFYLPETDRSARRQGRPFSVTRRLDAGSKPGPVDLVLRGRLARLPDAKVVNCVAKTAALPPQCIISIRLDTVQLEQAEDGELLAQWSGA